MNRQDQGRARWLPQSAADRKHDYEGNGAARIGTETSVHDVFSHQIVKH